MPDWAALRHRAYEQHLKLRSGRREGEAPLIPAEALLKAAERETGLTIQPLPEGDPLLAGAQAFLDRDSEMVWFAAGGALTPERQRFAQAHEFAHFWLHPDVETDRAVPDDTPDTYLASSSSAAAQIEEGYSPQDRREREANVFAAELLLPAPLLREAFVDRGMRAPEIAALTGITETCVLTQMAHGLLVPGPAAPPQPADVAPGIDSLDPSQQAAAEAAGGPLLVDAGPGTGKTRTLTARIAHLIRDRSVPPESILALTFSNRAAEEMTDRLVRTLGETANRVWTGTFHAFGFEILRKEGHHIGLPPRPALVEPADAITLLEAHLDRLDLVEYEYLHNPALPFPDILDAISRAKDGLKSPEDYRLAAEGMAAAAMTEAERTEAARASEVAAVYRVYDELLRSMGLLDYGDLIARAVELLESHPDVRERWQRRHAHILADEYQDVNRATARLLQLLAGDGKGLWAVGDLRQAIYRFRGASPANIRRFQSDFPTGRRISLTENYRSRPGIVRLFQSFAAGMESAGGDAEGWNPSRAELPAPAVTIARAADEEAQESWLAAQIEKRAAEGVERRDQAILVPTNRHTSDIAGRLEARGVPVQYSGFLFDREEIKDLLALLSLASEPDGLGLIRVARFPEIGIPDQDARAILDAAREADQSFPLALRWSIENVSLSEVGRAGLARLNATLLPTVFRGDAWTLLSRYLFETSDYLGPLLRFDTVQNQQKRLAIFQLLLTVQQMTRQLPLEQRDNPRSALMRRLRRLLQLRQSRSVRIPEAGGEIDGVRVMTIHASKGLEFPVVYLPNLVKGQFPARGRGRMAALPAALDGDRTVEDAQSSELFFVALSRARDELVLSTTATWAGKAAEPAPLLAAIAGALEAEGASWVAADAVPGSGGPTAEEPTAELAAESADAEQGDRPEVLLSRLREYRACPRQYYYRRVLKLPHAAEDTAYREFHRHLEATLEWLQAERAAGRTPNAADALAEFNARWPALPPEEESALRRLLRRRAAMLLAQGAGARRPAGRAAAPEQLAAELHHGTVRLRADEVERAEGSVGITQYLHRRPKKGDHTEESLALLRLAARQRDPDSKVRVEVLSTATGDVIEVAEDRRWEPGRVEKFDAALEELGRGEFPAKPSDALCPSCPFFFICPT